MNSKKVLALVIALAMVMSIVPAFTITVSADTAYTYPVTSYGHSGNAGGTGIMVACVGSASTTGDANRAPYISGTTASANTTLGSARLGVLAFNLTDIDGIDTAAVKDAVMHIYINFINANLATNAWLRVAAYETANPTNLSYAIGGMSESAYRPVNNDYSYDAAFWTNETICRSTTGDVVAPAWMTMDVTRAVVNAIEAAQANGESDALVVLRLQVPTDAVNITVTGSEAPYITLNVGEKVDVTVNYVDSADNTNILGSTTIAEQWVGDTLNLADISSETITVGEDMYVRDASNASSFEIDSTGVINITYSGDSVDTVNPVSGDFFVISGSVPVLPATVTATTTLGNTVSEAAVWPGDALTNDTDAPVDVTVEGTAFGQTVEATVTVYPCDFAATDEYSGGAMAYTALDRQFTGVIYTEYDVNISGYGDIWVMYTPASVTATGSIWGGSAARLGFNTDGTAKVNGKVGGSATTLNSTGVFALNTDYRVFTKTDLDNQTFQLWITDGNGNVEDLTNGGMGYRSSNAPDITNLWYGTNGNGGLTVKNHKVFWESGYATANYSVYAGADAATALANPALSTESTKIAPGVAYSVTPEATLDVAGESYILEESVVEAAAPVAGDTYDLYAVYVPGKVKIQSIVNAPTAEVTVIEGNDVVLPATVTASLDNGMTGEFDIAWAEDGGVYTGTIAFDSAYELDDSYVAPTVTVTTLPCTVAVEDLTAANPANQALPYNFYGTVYTEFDLTLNNPNDACISYSYNNGEFTGEAAFHFNSANFQSRTGTNAGSAGTYTSELVKTDGHTYRVRFVIDTAGTSTNGVDGGTEYRGNYKIYIADHADGIFYEITPEGGASFRQAPGIDLDGDGTNEYVFNTLFAGRGGFEIANHKIYWASGSAYVTTETYLDDVLDSTTTSDLMPAVGSYTYAADDSLDINGTLYSLDSTNSVLTVDALAEGENTVYAMYYSTTVSSVDAVADVDVAKGSEPVLPATVSVTFSTGETGTVAATWSYDTDYTTWEAGEVHTATATINYYSGEPVTANINVWTNAADAAAINGANVVAGYIVEPTNLWVNGSFEDGLDGFYNVTGADGTNLTALPSNWAQYTDPVSDGTFSLGTTTGGGGTSVGSLAAIAYINGGKPATAGDKYLLVYDWYTVAGSMTSTVGLGNNANAAYVDESCGGLGNTGTSPVSCNISGYTTNAWNTMSYLLTATDETTVAIVYNRWLNTGDRFDNFRLYKVIGEVEGSGDCYNIVYVDVTDAFGDTNAVEIAAPIGSTVTLSGNVQYNDHGIAYAYVDDTNTANTCTVSSDIASYGTDGVNIVYALSDALVYDFAAAGTAATVNAYNGSGESKTYYVIVTSYDADGTVLAINYEAVALADMSAAAQYDDVNYAYTYTADAVAGAASVKAFLWDGFTNIEPLAASVVTE